MGAAKSGKGFSTRNAGLAPLLTNEFCVEIGDIFLGFADFRFSELRNVRIPNAVAIVSMSLVKFGCDMLFQFLLPAAINSKV